MTEQQIQKKRIAQLEGQGYYVIKLTVTNKNGIPDLIAIHNGSNVLFCPFRKTSSDVSLLLTVMVIPTTEIE